MSIHDIDCAYFNGGVCDCSERSKLTLPTRLSVNGSSLQALLQPRADARLAISTAMRVLEQAAPHRRDNFWRNESDADQTIGFKAAMAAHVHRLSLLRDVLDELTAEIDTLDNW